MALRRVSTDAKLRIDIAALRAAIAKDRAADFQPACLIATAGTVNTGAIDDLDAMAEEPLRLHVDGCIGVLLAISPAHAHRVSGIARADSVALDSHKWPYEDGCTRRAASGR